MQHYPARRPSACATAGAHVEEKSHPLPARVPVFRRRRGRHVSLKLSSLEGKNDLSRGLLYRTELNRHLDCKFLFYINGNDVGSAVDFDIKKLFPPLSCLNQFRQILYTLCM